MTLMDEVMDMQKRVGYCSDKCIHYRGYELEMYCDHPDASVWEDITCERGMGQESPCILWEGKVGYCSKHEQCYIWECSKCLQEHYDDWSKEEKPQEPELKECRHDVVTYNYETNISTCDDCKNEVYVPPGQRPSGANDIDNPPEPETQEDPGARD